MYEKLKSKRVVDLNNKSTSNNNLYLPLITKYKEFAIGP